jgi:hypothetical protein
MEPWWVGRGKAQELGFKLLCSFSFGWVLISGGGQRGWQVADGRWQSFTRMRIPRDTGVGGGGSGGFPCSGRELNKWGGMLSHGETGRWTGTNR